MRVFPGAFVTPASRLVVSHEQHGAACMLFPPQQSCPSYTRHGHALACSSYRLALNGVWKLQCLCSCYGKSMLDLSGCFQLEREARVNMTRK